MNSKKLLFALLCAAITSTFSCKKDEIDKKTTNFLTCKIDGEAYAADSLIDEPRAILREEDESLVIRGTTATQSIKIYLYGQSEYTGSFRFGDWAAGNTLKHYARISIGPNGNPEDYANDSWFSNGGYNADGITWDGTVAITNFDPANHRIEGTFEGNFYNIHESTLKRITEGKFSLPLITYL